MCGIFGLLQSQPFNGHELIRMSQSIRHRGPDDEGFMVISDAHEVHFGGADTPDHVMQADLAYTPRERIDPQWRSAAGGLAFGHRRLSIVDLSLRGHQPCMYGDRYWITYNGEVYNYIELREELKAEGFRFETESDTEVILAAYMAWGKDCLRRFNGMWALAIYDARTQEVFLARDRFGVKPLYYTVEGGRFAFASEIKVLAQADGWKARADETQLLDFLAWDITDHTDRTTFAGVRQLPAGSFMVLNLRDWQSSAGKAGAQALRIERWYEAKPASYSSREAVDMLPELMASAVSLRLRADVPVGSCLSGGLDSSAIVCLMRKGLSAVGSTAALKTFTAGSNDAAFDETRFARTVIEAAGTEAHFVTPEPSRLFDQVDKLVWHQDEPFGSTSIFAQWCVFDLASRNDIVVMLDGQGADEIFGGYRGFFGAYLAGLVRSGNLSGWMREAAAMRQEIGFSRVRSIGYTAAYLYPKLVSLLGKFDGRAYSDQDWLAPGARRVLERNPYEVVGGRTTSVRELSVAQLTSTNLPRLLHWEDRNSMAFSLEARVPFLDYRVVECALAMDDAEKVGAGVSKRVLRESMRGLVPDAVLDRRDKMGFVTAEPAWVRDPAYVQIFRRELEESVARLPGYVAPGIVDRFDAVVRGEKKFDFRYWRTISAGKWAKTFDVAA